MKSILDKNFKYTKSVETDLKKTFARIRREQAAQKSTMNKTVVNIADIKGTKNA